MKVSPCHYSKCLVVSLLFVLTVFSLDVFAVDHPACGVVLETHKGEAARSNGVDMWTEECCGGCNGTYGDRYQCPEIVRRFYSRVLGENTSGWKGNAVTYYSKASEFGLERYPNGSSVAPEVDDVVVFAGPPDSAGHVAVVKSVGSDTVTIIEQNWSDTGTRDLLMARNSGKYTLTSPRGNYQVLGWLRKEQQNSITVNFRGVVQNVVLFGDANPPDIDEGDTLSGSYELDLNTPESEQTEDDRNFGLYFEAVSNVRINVGPYRFYNNGPDEISVRNNDYEPGWGTFDLYGIYMYRNVRGSAGDWNPTTFVLQLFDPSASAFSSDEIPRRVPSPNDFDSDKTVLRIPFEHEDGAGFFEVEASLDRHY